jgi:hypothetical protein
VSLHRTDEWYVGFVPAPNRGLWRIARGRFAHCMAFRPCSGGWLLVEHNVWGLTCCVLGDSVAVNLARLCVERGALLRVPARRRDFRWLPPPLLSCVTVVLALVGVRAWVLTPRQLHGALLRRGALVVSGLNEDQPP